MNRKANTVLMLGAGASRASQRELPTMRGFFGPSLDEIPKELREFLQWFYPGTPPGGFNLEEVLSYLYLSAERASSWAGMAGGATGTAHDFRYEHLLTYVQNRLEIPQHSTCDKHVAVFSRLDFEDTILTLNYDLIADQSLMKVETTETAGRRELKDWSRLYKLDGLIGEPNFYGGSPPSLSPREEEWGFYLKLHGSLDWFYCPNRGCQKNQNIHRLSPSAFPAGRVQGQPCRQCGSPLRTFMVPPLPAKRVEPAGRLSFLWNLALRELRQAARVIVIGVSFAPSDFELRWLVRQSAALRETPVELEIVNLCAEDRQAARLLFGPGCQSRMFATLDDYLAGKEIWSGKNLHN